MITCPKSPPCPCRAHQIEKQRRKDRGWKLYSCHALETECIGKGKAHKPYEFSCKVSISTKNARSPGGQFVIDAQAIHGRPYDASTLADVVARVEARTGARVQRCYVDKGYRGHKAPDPRRVFISGQKRGVHGQIKEELRCRAAVEPVIGHLKNDGHMGRNYLKGRHGDKANAILSATGYNFRLILRWLRRLFPKILPLILSQISEEMHPISAS